MKPRIDRSTFKSITIKAGRTHKWAVDVSGEPPPTCSWIWRDNISLVSTEKIKIENIDYHTDFTILSAMRRDTGKYTLIAENASGKDQETVELTVLGTTHIHIAYFYIEKIGIITSYQKASSCQTADMFTSSAHSK